MANNPTMTNKAEFLLNALTYFHRNGQYPLDDTSLWNTLADFTSYIQEAGSYRYPGQLVSITNGDAYDGSNDKDVTLAIVRPNGTVQKVGSEMIFESTGAAEAYITKNPDFADAGKTLTVKSGDSYALYVIKPDKTIARVSFEQSDIPTLTWDAIQGKPTSSVTDIDSAVTLSKRFNTPEEGNLTFDAHEIAYKTDIPTTYDATKINGVIPVANLPAGALERMYVADNAAARLALTTTEVQNGDTVKDADTGLLWYVSDDTKLGSDTPEAAFTQYTAGAATSVPWSGVSGTPTTLNGYGITDAVNTADLAANYNEGKVVIWKNGTNATTSTTYNIEGKANEAAMADRATMAADSEKLGGQLPAYYAKQSDMDTVKTQIGTAAAGDAPGTGILGDIDSLEQAVNNLEQGTGITQIDASKITGTINMSNLPNDVKFTMHTVADEEGRFALTEATVQNGDVVKQTDTEALYFVIDKTQLTSENGYQMISTPTLAWEKITGTPTTLAGYGITDAINVSEKSATYGEGKVVIYQTGTNATTSTSYEINAKANTAALADRATMAADSEKLNGKPASYYATKGEHDTLAGVVGDTSSGLVKDVNDLKTNVSTITDTIGTAPDGGDNPGSGILKDIADLKKGDTITQIDASKITGTIDLANLPKTVVERLTIVTNEEALKALTTEQVQNGDSVKVSDSGLMYFVKDDTKLGSADTAMQAFEPYTVGIAGSVEWSGVLSKPTTLAGYGITDAVNANEKVTTANASNAGKILVLNAAGKLDVDITGAADFTKLINAPTSTAAQIDQAVTNAEHTNRAMLDKIGEDTSDGTRLTYASEGYAKKAELDEVALGALKVVEAGALPEDAATGQMVLEKIGA